MEKIKESALTEIKVFLNRIDRHLNRIEGEVSDIKKMNERTATQQIEMMGKLEKITEILKELLRRKYLTFDAMEVDEKELIEHFKVSQSTFYRWRKAKRPDKIKSQSKPNGRIYYTVKDIQEAIEANNVPPCIGRVRLIIFLAGMLFGASWPYNVKVDDELNIID